MPLSANARVAVQFVLLALTWGSSFLFIKIGLDGLSPAQVAWSRIVLGAAALVAITLFSRRRLPTEPRLWAHMVVVSVLVNVAPFLLFGLAERSISSGLASILNATTPLTTLLVAMLALPQERPTPSRIAGLVLGFGGVLVVLGIWQGLGPAGPLLGQIQCLAATTCYGLGFVYLRRTLAQRGLAPLSLATMQVGTSAVIMLALTPLLTSPMPRLDVRVVLAMLALGIAGTALAYIWNTAVLSAWGAVSAASVTYLIPLVGVGLGVAVLGERLRWNQPVGAVVVILGVLVGQGRLSLGRHLPAGTAGTADSAASANRLAYHRTPGGQP